MATPNKPTPEELKAKEDEAIRVAEEIEEKGVPEEEEEEEIPPKTPESEEVVEETPEVEEEEEEEEEEVEPSKELYKKKFSESSREAQKIAAKNRVINKALIDAEEAPEPTEEDLIKEFPDWDVMSETERGLAKETVISRQWRQTISKAKEQATKIEKWNESVEEFIDDPKTLVDSPELEGKTEEFKTFAIEEANNSVPYKLLVSAFLHDQQTKQVKQKGKMFENGSGGPNEKPQLKDGMITLEEARRLRESPVEGSYQKYKDLLMAGKIKSDL
jgi:hypothetical protein